MNKDTTKLTDTAVEETADLLKNNRAVINASKHLLERTLAFQHDKESNPMQLNNFKIDSYNCTVFGEPLNKTNLYGVSIPNHAQLILQYSKDSSTAVKTWQAVGVHPLSHLAPQIGEKLESLFAEN